MSAEKAKKEKKAVSKKKEYRPVVEMLNDAIGIINDVLRDAERFDRGIVAPGRRIRVALQNDLKPLIKEIRTTIAEVRKQTRAEKKEARAAKKT